VVTNFLGCTNLIQKLNPPVISGGTVALTWSALEGGTYEVETTTNLESSWNVSATGVTPNEISAGVTNAYTAGSQFFRVVRTAVAAYQGAGTTTFGTSGSGGGGATVNAPGGTVTRGTTVTVSITLPSNPPAPPANAPITSATLAGTINGTNLSDATSGTVLATFTIPANAPTGAQTLVITFQNPGTGPTPTFTLTGGLTIQ